jgi:hypothetical protein
MCRDALVVLENDVSGARVLLSHTCAHMWWLWLRSVQMATGVCCRFSQSVALLVEENGCSEWLVQCDVCMNFLQVIRA